MIENMTKELVFSTLNSLCDKYNFKLKNAGINDNFYYEVYAKNTDGKDVIWFDIQVSNHDSAYGKLFEPILTVYGNTDQNNIWLSDTRKDLTLKDVIYFCNKIASLCNCKLVTHSTDNSKEIYIHHLVDLEDLQEFKDFISLEDIEKMINLDYENDNNNLLEMYKSMPDYYKNNLEKLYILDGIYTVSPDISKEDAELIYSICEKNLNENVNPFSISHYLTDHYTRGNITKKDLESARIGDITEAVFYDNLNYLKPISDEKEIDICD